MLPGKGNQARTQSLTSKLFAHPQQRIRNYCEEPKVHINLDGIRVASLCVLAERCRTDVKR